MSSISATYETFGPVVGIEFQLADRLAQSKFFTEAVVRVGRGVEAALYATASELSIDLTNRVIKDLERVQNDLQNRQVNLLRRPTAETVRELANVSKLLAESIAQLSVSEDRRVGVLDVRPRANEQLLREMITSVQDDSVSRRLAEGLVVLRKVQDQRNRAAHASIDGCFAEFSEDEYDKVRADAIEVVNLLTDVLLGVRAATEWPVQEVNFVIQIRKT